MREKEINKEILEINKLFFYKNKLKQSHQS
jgi:hypothetical protein